jgi:hypothetical protein
MLAVLGLLLGVGAQAFVQDKGKEKAARPVVKWEYKVVNIEGDPTKMEDALNKLGEQGWEYVGTVRTIKLEHYICKRPK